MQEFVDSTSIVDGLRIRSLVARKYIHFLYKVVTTMVIKPLDDPIRCAQSVVVADLRPLGLGYVWGREWANSIASPWVPISSLITHMVYLLPFSHYWNGLVFVRHE